MENLKDILKEKGYKRLSFRISKTQHLFIKAKINGITGDFILDTGASNSCIDKVAVEYFEMKTTECPTLASGAGSNELETKLSCNNILSLGRWKEKNMNFVVLDLTHINFALTQYKVKQVHGIIGADVLMSSEAIIDYKNNLLYLK